MRYCQHIIGWPTKGGLGATRDGIHLRPIRIIAQKADKFSRCGRRSAMRKAHPQHDFGDQWIRSGRIGFRLSPTRPIGGGDCGPAGCDARSLR
jgi:hypothetical protein